MVGIIHCQHQVKAFEIIVINLVCAQSAQIITASGCGSDSALVRGVANVIVMGTNRVKFDKGGEPLLIRQFFCYPLGGR